MAETEDATDNHWTLVQTPTGKIIERARAEVLQEDAFVCENPGHYGIYFEPGNCRICGEPRVQKVVPIGFKEGATEGFTEGFKEGFKEGLEDKA